LLSTRNPDFPPTKLPEEPKKFLFTIVSSSEHMLGELKHFDKPQDEDYDYDQN
jgi:hypothetical protein